MSTSHALAVAVILYDVRHIISNMMIII